MRVPGEKRSKQILDVAPGLCAMKGFSGTTLDAVLRRQVSAGRWSFGTSAARKVCIEVPPGW